MLRFVIFLIFFAFALSGCYTKGNLTAMVMGTKEYSQRDYGNAIPRFRRILARDPSNQAALRMLAWSYYYLENYQKSEEIFINYGRHYPAEPEVYKGLAWCHYQMGEITRASKEFKKWISVSPDSKEAREGLAACFIELGRDIEALNELKKYYHLEEITQKFSSWYYPFLLLGQKRMDSRDYSQAHYYFQSALQFNPECLPAREGIRKLFAVGEKRIQLARQYQESERYILAVRFYTETSDQFPFWAEPYIGLGESYLKMDHFIDAEASFRKALYLDPDNQKARQGIRNTINQRDPNLKAAWESLKKGKYMDAVASFEVVVKGPNLYNIPEDQRWVVYRGLGWSYYHLSNYEEARANFEEALRRKQNDPTSLKGLGLTYYHEKKYNPAEMFMEMASASLQEDLELAVALGWTYYRKSKFKKAVEQFEFASSLNPNHLGIRRGMAWANYKAGNLMRAKGDFQNLLKIDPNYIADEEFHQFVTLNPKWWEFSNVLGWHFYKEKKMLKAVAAFQSSLEQMPKNPEALQGLAFICFREKNYKETIQKLKLALEGGNETEPVLEQDIMDDNSMIFSSTRSKLAWAYYFSGKFREATEEFQSVLKKHSDWIDPLYGLALSRQKLGQLDKAEVNYNAILSQTASHSRALTGIKEIKNLREKERKKKAREKKKRIKKKRSKKSKLEKT